MLFFISVLLFFSSLIYADTHDLRLWSSSTITGYVLSSKRVRYMINPEIRFSVREEGLEEAIIRAGLGYQHKPTISFWGAYGWFMRADTRNEQRIWEDILWDMYISDTWMLSSRTRFEQRKRVDGIAWAHRVRQKCTITFPQSVFKKHGLIVFDEIFINITRPLWIDPYIIDQNRLFIGVAIALSQDVSIEVGYLNQYLFRIAGNEMNHILYLTFNLQL